MDFFTFNHVLKEYHPERGETEAILPDHVQEIAEGIFEDRQSLKHVVLPQSLKTIGKYAFADCWKLKELILPSHVTEIGARAFGGCYALERVVIREGVEELLESAFFECTSLAVLHLPNGLRRIEDSAISYTGVTSLTIPDSVEEIEQCGVGENTNLRSISLPADIVLDEEALSCNDQLTSVTIRTAGQSFTFHYEKHFETEDICELCAFMQADQSEQEAMLAQTETKYKWNYALYLVLYHDSEAAKICFKKHPAMVKDLILWDDLEGLEKLLSAIRFTPKQIEQFRKYAADRQKMGAFAMLI